jgi:hypothetical protein
MFTNLQAKNPKITPVIIIVSDRTKNIGLGEKRCKKRGSIKRVRNVAKANPKLKRPLIKLIDTSKYLT